MNLKQSYIEVLLRIFDINIIRWSRYVLIWIFSNWNSNGHGCKSFWQPSNFKSNTYRLIIIMIIMIKYDETKSIYM